MTGSLSNSIITPQPPSRIYGNKNRTSYLQLVKIKQVIRHQDTMTAQCLGVFPWEFRWYLTTPQQHQGSSTPPHQKIIKWMSTPQNSAGWSNPIWIRMKIRRSWVVVPTGFSISNAQRSNPRCALLLLVYVTNYIGLQLSRLDVHVDKYVSCLWIILLAMLSWSKATNVQHQLPLRSYNYEYQSFAIVIILCEKHTCSRFLNHIPLLHIALSAPPHSREYSRMCVHSRKQTSQWAQLPDLDTGRNLTH